MKMPGLQLASFWEGNRSELFAAYILSGFAAVVPVPRPMDFGVDFFCTLTHLRGNALYAGRAFELQVKTGHKIQVKYGGLDNGAWKAYELDWLYGQDQPIILCVVDLDAWELRLYSTVRMWWVRYQWGRPGEVILTPDLEFQGESAIELYPRSPLPPPDDGRPAGDGYSYKIPLGKPIISISLKDLKEVPDRDILRQVPRPVARCRLSKHQTL